MGYGFPRTLQEDLLSVPRPVGVVTLIWAVTAALGGTRAATAQPPTARPDSGARVRLSVPCPSGGPDRMCRLEGRLVRIGADTITLTVDAAPASVGLSVLRRLHVSRGRRSYWLWGAGVGFLVGAGVTYTVRHTGGSTALCDRSANQDAMSTGECLGLTALGGAARAGVGAPVGGLIRTERWEDVPVERLRVGLWQPPGRGAGVAVSLRL